MDYCVLGNVWPVVDVCFHQWDFVLRCTSRWSCLVVIWYLWLLEHTRCQCCECSHVQHQRSATDRHGIASVLMSDMMECPANLATDGTKEHADADWLHQLDHMEVLHKTKSNLDCHKTLVLELLIGTCTCMFYMCTVCWHFRNTYVKQNFNGLLIHLHNISSYLLYNLFSQAALPES